MKATMFIFVGSVVFFGGRFCAECRAETAYPTNDAAKLSTGSSNLPNPADGCVNVREPPFNARGDGKADDSTAFVTAINRLNSLRQLGEHYNLCIPPGYYRLAANTLPTFLYGGFVVGSYHHSVIKLDPAYKGDLFSWSEAWEYGASYSPSHLPLSAATERAGPGATGLLITGSRTTDNLQNAFVFYNRDDLILMRDIEVRGLHGRGLALGLQKSQDVAYSRESNFFNLYLSDCGAIVDSASHPVKLRAGSAEVTVTGSTNGISAGMSVVGPGISDGDEVESVGTQSFTLTHAATLTGNVSLKTWTDIPSMEINSAGSGDSTNELNFFAVNVFEPAGRGLVIRNRNPRKRVGQLRFFGLRIEGGSFGQGDQLQLGDESSIYSGGLGDIWIYGFVSNTSATGFASIASYASTMEQQPYGITVQGQIATGNGLGINVQSGRELRFEMQDMATRGTALKVGPSPSVGRILIDGHGNEKTWRTEIDPSSTSHLQMPTYVPFVTSSIARPDVH